jgi:hypothetical protein
MRIKLVGALPTELKDFSLKPGDIVDAYPATGTIKDTMQFKLHVAGEIQIATVYPENYKKL